MGLTLPVAFLVVIWLGLTAYVLFAGADFGAGFWDLIAGGPQRGRAQRELIEHSIGPVWEANHVWLIFVIVMLWTGFPGVFAAVASTAFIPLTLAALGIIARGSAFAFRKVSVEVGQRRLLGAVFASSSVLTPFFLGTVAGGIASGRIPIGVGQGDVITSWWNPTSIAVGLLSTGVGAYLAACFLTRDAEREAPALVEPFRRRALAAALVVGALAVVSLVVVRTDAPTLFAELRTMPALWLVLVSILAGLASIVLLRTRQFLAVRLTAALTVAAVLWGWAVGQYPYLLPDTTVTQAVAQRAVLTASLAALAVGAVIVLPSLWWLYALFQRQRRHDRGSPT